MATLAERPLHPPESLEESNELQKFAEGDVLDPTVFKAQGTILFRNLGSLSGSQGFPLRRSAGWRVQHGLKTTCHWQRTCPGHSRVFQL